MGNQLNWLWILCIFVLRYEWGDLSHHSASLQSTPDDTAQRQVAKALSKFAGPWTRNRHPGRDFYPTGTINSLVYPVNGGAEDWAYAGSWMNSVMPITIV